MWQDIKHSNIALIEKLVGEYDVWVLEKSPYGKFKIKIYENSMGRYTGYTNLKVVDEMGEFKSAVGYGETEEEAFGDTLEKYFELVSWKSEWEESDFQCANPFEF